MNRFASSVIAANRRPIEGLEVTDRAAYCSPVARKVDVDDLVSAADIAERLELPYRSLVHGWVKRFSDFPKPVAQLGIGKVWSWREVERWAAKGGPRGTRARRY